MSVLRTAVVGLGEVAAWHRVGIGNAPGASLVAVADTDETRVDRASTEWEVAGYTSLDALLDAEPVDWVHVCTPVATHFDLAMRCVDARVPVLVEKPFVRTREEFEALTAAADDAGVRATVVHNQAYYPPFREARRRIGAGEFGRLRGVSVRWAEDLDPRDPDRGDWVLDLPGGEFGEGIVHPIYVGLRAAGYPADTSSVAIHRTATVEGVEFDGIAVSYATADGVTCTIQHHSSVPDRRRIDFAAEGGHLTVDVGSGSVRSHRRSYGPNAPYTRPMLRAGLRELRNAAGVAAGALARTLRGARSDSGAYHDTHTPVIRRETSAIRGQGEGSTPRAEADWANRIFTGIIEG